VLFRSLALQNFCVNEFSLFNLLQKYLAPALWGKKTADDVCNSMDQLRRGVEELTTGMKETQQLLQNQQRTLDDIIRSTSLQRVSIIDGRV